MIRIFQTQQSMDHKNLVLLIPTQKTNSGRQINQGEEIT